MMTMMMIWIAMVRRQCRYAVAFAMAVVLMEMMTTGCDRMRVSAAVPDCDGGHPGSRANMVTGLRSMLQVHDKTSLTLAV